MDDIVQSLAIGALVGAALYCALRARGGQTWAGKPADPVKAAPPLAYGGVVQQRTTSVPPLPITAKVLPAISIMRVKREADGGITPLTRAERNPYTDTVRLIPAGLMETMHPAMATDDAACAKLICELWRYPSTVSEEDGA